MIRSILNLVLGPTENQVPEAVIPVSVAHEPEVNFEDMEVNHEGLHLFDLNEMLFEKIFSNLAISDLANFIRTSKTSKKIADVYLAHYLSSFGRRQKVQSLVESNDSYCFMPDQESTLSRLGQDIDSNNLRLFYFVTHVLIPAQTQTFLVEEAEDFCHLGNPEYIYRQWDASLQRNIVVLRTVCWLKFVKNLGFQHPGRYQARLRLFIDSGTRWPTWHHEGGPTPAILSVYKLSRDAAGEVTRTPLVQEEFMPEYWEQIDQSSFNNSQLRHCQVVRDVTSPNWYYIEFEPIVITEETELDFEFLDIQNTWWKRGMKWDVIELRRLKNVK